jgi:hypothetical protein
MRQKFAANQEPPNNVSNSNVHSGRILTNNTYHLHIILAALSMNINTGDNLLYLLGLMPNNFKHVSNPFKSFSAYLNELLLTTPSKNGIQPFLMDMLGSKWVIDFSQTGAINSTKKWCLLNIL